MREGRTGRGITFFGTFFFEFTDFIVIPVSVFQEFNILVGLLPVSYINITDIDFAGTVVAGSTGFADRDSVVPGFADSTVPDSADRDSAGTDSADN